VLVGVSVGVLVAEQLLDCQEAHSGRPHSQLQQVQVPFPGLTGVRLMGHKLGSPSGHDMHGDGPLAAYASLLAEEVTRTASTPISMNAIVKN